MLNRGAPAPQCEPLRMSYPISVSVIPSTGMPVMNASADAKLFVGPVLMRTRPLLLLSVESPVGQAGSVNGGCGVPFTLYVAPVGQPAPTTHADETSFVWNGSNV